MSQPTAVLSTLQILPLNITEHSALMETLLLLALNLRLPGIEGQPSKPNIHRGQNLHNLW